MPTWIQHPVTLELVPKDQYIPPSRGSMTPGVMPDIEPFVSPVDGSVISSRTRLREHNRRHGVTQTLDYGPEWFKRKAKEHERERQMTTERHRKARKEALCAAIDRLQHKGR